MLDVGRKPVARFPDGDVTLTDSPVSYEEVENAAALVGEFKADNRAGALHTIVSVDGRTDCISIARLLN